jgi:hypothetical protein
MTQNMEKAFDDRINKARFSALEMEGFRREPLLAIKSGMAIGYRMAIEQFYEFTARLGELYRIGENLRKQIHNSESKMN